MWTYQFVMMQSVAEKHGWTKFVSMQNQYSLLYREEEREMNKYCDLTGVGLVPWSPLAGGLLARGLEEQGKTSRSKLYTLTEVDKVIIGRVEEIAKKKEWKIPYVGIAWINDKCASPIVGIGSLERLDDAIAAASAALEKPLTEEEIKYLEEPYVPKTINGHS
jgi:aryl-alcohol dehydrogenase-like predicted oxidoreductase